MDCLPVGLLAFGHAHRHAACPHGLLAGGSFAFGHAAGTPWGRAHGSLALVDRLPSGTPPRHAVRPLGIVAGGIVCLRARPPARPRRIPEQRTRVARSPPNLLRGGPPGGMLSNLKIRPFGPRTAPRGLRARKSRSRVSEAPKGWYMQPVSRAPNMFVLIGEFGHIKRPVTCPGGGRNASINAANVARGAPRAEQAPN